MYRFSPFSPLTGDGVGNARFASPAERRRLEEQEASHQARAAEAAAFLKREFDEIATKQLSLIKKIDIGALSVAETREAVEDINRKCALAQSLVVKQSDLRWGSRATNVAIEYLGGDYYTLRKNIDAED